MKRAAQQLIGVTIGSILGALGLAASAGAMTLVNTELMLSIDVSGSVNEDEYALQIQGYIDAFNSASVRNRITGLSKGVAVGVNVWDFNVVSNSGFSLLNSEASIDAFVSSVLGDLLLNRPGSGGTTNIAAGINDATNALLTNDFEGDRLVIDVSGDGKQNTGTGCTTSQMETVACTSLVTAARDAAVDAGITINGLPILTRQFPNLDTYYSDFVIGGDGSFLVAADDFSDFSNAVEQKIEREIVPPSSESTPEPTSLLGLGLIGLAGAGAALKRKQREI